MISLKTRLLLASNGNTLLWPGRTVWGELGQWYHLSLDRSIITVCRTLYLDRYTNVLLAPYAHFEPRLLTYGHVWYIVPNCLARIRKYSIVSSVYWISITLLTRLQLRFDLKFWTSNHSSKNFTGCPLNLWWEAFWHMFHWHLFQFDRNYNFIVTYDQSAGTFCILHKYFMVSLGVLHEENPFQFSWLGLLDSFMFINKTTDQVG
jgi:hypothetical protein